MHNASNDAGSQYTMIRHAKICASIAIRFRDVDAMGHVNNAEYLTYFEEGRKAFLKEVMGIEVPADYPFILARAVCDYIRPIPLSAEISVMVWISRIGKKSFNFRYEIIDTRGGPEPYARGESVMVWYDYTSGKTALIPEETAAKLREYREKSSTPASSGTA